MQPRRKLHGRLSRYSAAAGMVAAGAASAQGGIIYVNDSFTVTAPVSGQTTHLWDIDGNGTNDFQIIGQNSYGAFNVHIARIIGPPPNHFVVAANTGSHYTHTMKPLPLGFTIKATGMASGAKFQLGSQLINFTNQGVANAPLHMGEQFVGFEFLISGTTHYGWADITIGTKTVTFDRWSYQSLANTGIVVVPEPADSAAGLGLLALGAAGVAAYKRRKQQAV